MLCVWYHIKYLIILYAKLLFFVTRHSLPETRVHELRIYENILESYHCLLDICIKVNYYLGGGGGKKKKAVSCTNSVDNNKQPFMFYSMKSLCHTLNVSLYGTGHHPKGKHL